MPQPHFAIIVSRFNEEITGGLLRGAMNYFSKHGIQHDQIDVVYAPGAFEIPIIAKGLAQTEKYSGIICLGCVIKGETAHFEYISDSCCQGMMQVMLETNIPLHFGVLTTYTREQAEVRSRDDDHNKGGEAAAACWGTYNTLLDVSSLNRLCTEVS